MKIIFFGSAKFIVPVIDMLNKQFDLALVVTTEKNPLDSVPSFCKEKNIPFLSVNQFSDCMEKIKAEKADVAVLASFGLFLPQEALDIFPQGILNIHPSLLPLYRGPTPVQSALLNGDEKTGVSIIKLDKDMDHGPLLAQETAEIHSNDTTASLHDKLFTKGAELLQELLPSYLAGETKLREQDHDKATYTSNALTKQDGFINSQTPPDKKTLDQMIRAYYPWPTVWTTVRIKNQELRIKLLPGNKLQAEGKKPISVKDFVNGYPEIKDTFKKILGSLDS